MRLFYSDTNYGLYPPQDISPIIPLQPRILVICARQGMIDRLSKLGILAIGIWEISEKAFMSIMDISDTIVIVGRKRVHSNFEEKISHLEEYALNISSTPEEHSYLC